MNNFYYLSLLVFALAIMPQVVGAQSEASKGGKGDLTVGITSNAYPAVEPGEHVPGQLIITFSNDADKAIAVPGIQKELRELGAETFEFSPTEKYMLATWPEDKWENNDFCSIIGDGTNNNLREGQGTGVDLNYIVGVSPQSMGEGAQLVCMDYGHIDQAGTAGDEEGGFNMPDFDTYSPLSECKTPHQRILPTVNEQGSIVKVAIIDSKFSDNDLTRLGGRPVGQSFDSDLGPNKHGDIIANIIAGQAHAAGVADRIQLYSYQVLDENLRGDIWTVINALETAALPENGINIVNLSLAFPAAFPCRDQAPMVDMGDVLGDPDVSAGEPTVSGDPKPDDRIISLLHAPLKALRDANILVINAAGNDGRELTENQPVFPAMEEGLYNLITVGALGCGQNQIADWSNRGSDYIELYAPGSNITPYFNCEYTVDGTSFAAPIVTAAAAIHATTLPSFNIYDVLCYLQSAAEPFEGASWGILDNHINTTCQKSTPTFGKSFAATDNVKQLTATPNPFTGELKLLLPSTNDGEAINVRLLDVNGKVVLQQTATGESISLDTNTLPRGVYFVNVRNSTINETTTVVRR